MGVPLRATVAVGGRLIGEMKGMKWMDGWMGGWVERRVSQRWCCCALSPPILSFPLLHPHPQNDDDDTHTHTTVCQKNPHTH